MFEATIAGSLPKPAWLSETHKLWPQWRAQGAELLQAKADGKWPAQTLIGGYNFSRFDR